jgi:predicted Zn finger-like uncharacterized protein
MRFECDSCNAKYKISDEKVRGRVVRFPCRKCEHKILIDGRQHDADVTVPAGEAYSFDDVTRRSEPASPFSAHEAQTARARRPSSPPRRRSPSVPPRRASAASRRVSSIPTGTTPAAAASSAFVGEKYALTPPLPDVTIPSAPAATDQRPEWHVSVNDVPIGPIRLEEMGHKIDAGAVSEYSLVWRDGFEDWRPLATVPELMSLLHDRRHSGPPPRSTFSSMPPFVDTRASLSDPAPAPALPATMPVVSAPLSSPPIDDGDEFEPLADALQPEGDPGVGLDAFSQPPATLTSEDTFQSSTQLGSYSGLPPTPDDEVSVPSTPPAAASGDDEPDRLSLGVWALILALIVFASVAAYLAYERFGDQILGELFGAQTSEPAVRAPKAAPPEPADATNAAAEPAADADTAAGEATADATEEAAEGEGDATAAADTADTADDTLEDTEAADSEEPAQGETADAKLVPPPDPKADTPKIAPAPRVRPKTRRKPRPAPVAAAPKPASEPVSAADQKILDEFDSGSDAAPAKIAVKQNTSAQGDKPALDGDAVRRTVAENKPRLQRCYERAIRGQTSTEAVRLDVTVQVAASGRVKSVSASDGGPGGLAECIEASVRRWRFPETSDGGPAKFPLVFSAN